MIGNSNNAFTQSAKFNCQIIYFNFLPLYICSSIWAGRVKRTHVAILYENALPLTHNQVLLHYLSHTITSNTCFTVNTIYHTYDSIFFTFKDLSNWLWAHYSKANAKNVPKQKKMLGIDKKKFYSNSAACVNLGAIWDHLTDQLFQWSCPGCQHQVAFFPTLFLIFAIFPLRGKERAVIWTPTFKKKDWFLLKMSHLLQVSPSCGQLAEL